jgi:hypothetical protein
MTVAEFLKASTDAIFPLNDYVAADVNVGGKWVLAEISESPQHLPAKLFQTERAM